MSRIKGAVKTHAGNTAPPVEIQPPFGYRAHWVFAYFHTPPRLTMSTEVGHWQASLHGDRVRSRGATRFYRISKRAISDSYLKLRSRDFIRADIPGAGTRGYTDKSGCRATPNAAHVSRPRRMPDLYLIAWAPSARRVFEPKRASLVDVELVRPSAAHNLT